LSILHVSITVFRSLNKFDFCSVTHVSKEKHNLRAVECYSQEVKTERTQIGYSWFVSIYRNIPDTIESVPEVY